MRDASYPLDHTGPQSAKLDDGRSHLRVIMNLIPSNAVLHQLSGCVQELPSITQYMSLVLEDGESLSLCQSDMTSAFYLFRLPEEWERYLAFNVVVQGSQIGLEPSKKYCLACRVLPMGWSSAVSVMQEVSQILLEKGGADLSLQVSRTRPLPSWLTVCLKESRESRRAWYHIYLDNYFSGERIGAGEAGGEAALLHHEAEEIWNKAGVLSSEKKRVRDASEVEELGAQVDSDAKLIGASAGRLLKLLQTTCLVLSKERIPRKWLQVVCGRWVHVLQFRRAGMSSLSAVWRCIGGKRVGAKALLEARRELCRVMCGTMLFHTFLGACVSETTTASDASGTGGAVGRSDVLSSVGSDFCRSLGHAERCIKVPVLVLSLFNGVGGAFRAYDLVGVEVMGLVSFETDKSANRVSSRRWPHAVMKGDVRSIDRKWVMELLLKYPHVLQIDLWAGFPCVDLSAVKFMRENLAGKESGLFREVLRVLELLRSVFGRKFPIFFFVENVASMDKSAAKEIGDALGCKPYKLQCAQAVPISRPRFCWTNKKLPKLPGVSLRDHGDYIEVTAEAEYPQVTQWIREDSWWNGKDSDTVFPTCMKSIVRARPPPAPAGLSRCSEDTVARWQSDSFRYPPYQYKQQYILWSDKGWRLLESSKRELLHGYGYEHTKLCWAASEIKKNQRGYEDQRCTLIGDSFSLYSFVLFAWASCFEFLPPLTYSHLTKRMGMAPGFCAPIDMECPPTRELSYGCSKGRRQTVGELSRLLLTRVNHTGSDIRVSSGTVMNPKTFPRQSACSDWWLWKHVFHCRWSRKEHINRLEMRSILLALRWRIQHLKEVNCRFIHLTDSYVSMSIISKGRSSSLMLMSVMQKIAAVQFAFNLYPILIHVESTDNPTDEGSRL